MSRRSKYREKASEYENAEGVVAQPTGSSAGEQKDKSAPETGFSGVNNKPQGQFGNTAEFQGVPPIVPNERDVDLSGLDVPAERSIEDFLDENSEYGKIPQPEVFNAYPPELQRKIMEWTDRDVRARRDDESRRRDEIMRAEIDRERRRQMFPAVITVLALLCAAVTGVVTGNPLFPLVFLLVPLAVIAARVAGDDGSGGRENRRNKPPKV